MQAANRKTKTKGLLDRIKLVPAAIRLDRYEQ
jgi:hypothetical protein